MIKPLHGIRGLAALAVFFYHYFPLLSGQPRVAFPGEHAVDVFFCLSGFVLTHVYFQRLVESGPTWREYRSFLRNRFARVAPLAIITTLAFIALICVAHGINYSLQNKVDLSFLNIAGNLLFLDGTVPWITTLHTPKWSVSNEVWAYVLIFPAVCYWYRHCSKMIKGGLCFGVICVQVLFYDSLQLHGGNFLARCAPEFLLGFFVCDFLRHPLCGKLPCAAAWVNGAFCVGIVLFFAPARFQGLAGMLIVAGGSQPLLVRPASYFLCSRLGFWFGEISYSLYLWHGLIQAALAPLRHNLPIVADHYSLFFLAFIVPATLAVAHVSYRFIECPLRDLLRTRPEKAARCAPLEQNEGSRRFHANLTLRPRDNPPILPVDQNGETAASIASLSTEAVCGAGSHPQDSAQANSGRFTRNEGRPEVNASDCRERVGLDGIVLVSVPPFPNLPDSHRS